jgi:aconitate decarboxylase
MNHLRDLACFVAELRYEQLPDELILRLKQSVLDSIGCALHGGSTQWGGLVAGYVSSNKGPCPVWATGDSVDAGSAALANGTMIHSFEMDDLHLPSRSHPGGVTIPVVFALAADGVLVDGRSLLLSLAAGYELTVRVGMCQGVSSFERGWHPTGSAGCFGSTAAAAKALGLSADHVQHALGVGGTMPCGLMAAQYGAMVKRLYAGHAAMIGLMAARLAAGGFTGITDIFDVEFGGYPHAVSDKVDLGWLNKGLGKEFESKNIGLKFYPSVGASQTALDSIKTIMKRNPFSLDQVGKVVVTTSEYQKAHAGWPYVPSTVMAAQMSIQYGAAVMLLYGFVSVEHYSETLIRDQAILNLANKVEVAVDPEQKDQDRGATVEIRLLNGTVLREETKVPRGFPGNAATWDDVTEKFRLVTAGILDQASLDEVVSIVHDIDSLGDINLLQEKIVAAVRKNRP